MAPPKREGVDALGVPLVATSSSRSRPGTSHANHQAGPYTFGTATFASSSSSSLGQLNSRGQAISEPNLATFSGPVPATEAPHLSTAEAFFGRMTLTAPDNMRRKKLEEREKKKQIRKKRAERGAMAAATLANPPEIGPSHLNQALSDAAIIAASSAAMTTTTIPSEPSSRRRKRPALPTSNSGSNLQIYTLEQSRSRSPTRHTRPQSAQGSTAMSRQESPERRQNRRRNRADSDGSVVEAQTRASGASTSAPSYQPANSSERTADQRITSPTSDEISTLPTAAQRRRDIYADLESLGLPGADEADLEDQPPPFPAYARRPISPPQMPAEGEEWTEEMRRRQEEYEMYRPPDSPPPAFRSDDETRQHREESGEISSSDEGSLSEEVIRERQVWEEDIAAGLTLEERIERDRIRREAREEQFESLTDQRLQSEAQVPEPISLLQPSASSDQEATEEAVAEENKLDEEPIPQILSVNASDETVPSRNNVTEARAEQGVSGEQPMIQASSQPELFEVPSPETTKQAQDLPVVTQPSLNLGRLVMEARARRASAAQQGSNTGKSESDHSRQPSNDSSKGTKIPLGDPLSTTISGIIDSAKPSGPKEPLESATTRLLHSFATQTLQRVASQPLHSTATISEAVPTPTTTTSVTQASVTQASHRRVASEEGAADLRVSPQKVRSATAAPTKKRIVATAGLEEGKVELKQEKAPLKAVNKRSRPSGEKHSRFRDGASAAANRRMLLWGPTGGVSNITSLPAPIPGSIDVSQIANDGEKTSSNQDPETESVRLLRQASSSSNAALTSAHEGDEEASSDSDAKWDKEEEAFQAIQRRLNPAPIEYESSEEDEATNTKKHNHQRPGWFRSNSMDLAKPGSSVPKAPPPLVLGRSRGGGAEYSSSSESSSESGAGRMDADSDDSLSPVEVEEAPSEGRPSFHLTDRASEKGKQPIRPHFDDPDRSISAPMPLMRSTSGTIRAGEFEEDSGSSHDFVSDEEETQIDQLKNPSSESLARPAVNNRLKTLFSTPLKSQEATALQPSASSRATLESLFEKQIDSKRPSIASRKSSLSIKDAEIHPSLSRQTSQASIRSRERANAYAALESKERDATNEEQNRLEALESIAKLQQVGYSGLRTTGVQQDSLEALERLLSRPPYVSRSNEEQSIAEGRAGLRRSGAINRQGIAGPFVNPRSSVAPRPLGRLPTITSATRHFPPTLQSATDSTSNVSTPSASSQSSQFRRGNIGTPSWMAYIPDNERRTLPEPLEPTKVNQNTSVNSSTPTGPPPPLPFRTAGNRVSAMVNRFEGQTSPTLSPGSSNKEATFATASPTPPVEEFRREDTLRRRPPPPPPSRPPPSSWQRQRPVSASVPRSPIIASSSDSFLTASSSQGDGLSSGLPALPFKRPVHEQLASGSTLREAGQSVSPALSSLQSPLLKDLSGLQIASTGESTAPALPRSRPRPLPIPPIFKSTALSTSSSSAPQLVDREVKSHQESSEEEQHKEGESSSASSLTRINGLFQSGPADAAASSSLLQEEAPRRNTTREASLGYTDLDLFASRLADQGTADGTNYEDLNLLAEFLGPAKPIGATAEEVEALSVGIIEVLRKRVVGKKENGKDKIKLVLNLMGVKVERCGVCLLQFKEGNLACLFPCLHVLHEDCATKLLRNTKLCPVCRHSIVP